MVGNLPTADGTAATAKPGSLLFIDKSANLVGTYSDPTLNLLNGPWDMTVKDDGDRAILFVSNVLIGTVTRLELAVGPASIESKELLKISTAAEEAWIDSILVLETSAELNLKDEMHIYGTTATSQELAGGGMFAFLGFFDLTLRQHDYNLGRQKARAFLAQHRDRTPEDATGSDEPSPDIGPIRYNPTDSIPEIPVPQRNPSGDVLISALDTNIRTRLLETTSQRVNTLLGDILASLRLPKFVIGPLSWLLGLAIKGEIKRRLAL